MITVQGNTLGTIITVVNWEVYQKEAVQGNTKETRKKHSLDTNKNDKEELKNEKKKDIEDFFNECWSMYPRKKGKDKISNTVKEKRFKMGDEFKRCIERHNKDVKGREMKHIQYGSTFWNSGYLDYTDENSCDSVKDAKDLPEFVPKFKMFDRDA